MINIELYKPFEHQRSVHDSITRHIDSSERFCNSFQKILVVKAMRQVGKSAMAENELIRFALQFSDSVNAYVAPTQNLSRKTFRELVKIIPEQLIKYVNRQDLIIEFINNSVIRFFSAAQRDGLRGFNVSGIMVIDEGAFITDDIYFECLSPWCDFHKAVTLIISTPKFRFGFFYDLYSEGLKDSSNIESFDWSAFDMYHVRSEDSLNEKRATMPIQQFNCEYLGNWADGIGSVFTGFTYTSNTEYSELYVGLDFGTGSGQDSTVLTALNENGDQVLIWESNTLSPVDQVKELTKVIQQNKAYIKKFNAEKNSIGKVYLDMLKKSNPGVMITEFNTDNESKRKLVEDLQVSFEQNRIRLKPSQDQSTQLSFYEGTVNQSTNKVSYNAAKGFHDDYVMALMLANHSYINRFSNYRFTIV